MRYRLRTLLIVLALGPALLAWAWLASVDLRKEWRQCFLVEAQLRTLRRGREVHWRFEAAKNRAAAETLEASSKSYVTLPRSITPEETAALEKIIERSRLDSEE